MNFFKNLCPLVSISPVSASTVYVYVYKIGAYNHTHVHLPPNFTHFIGWSHWGQTFQRWPRCPDPSRSAPCRHEVENWKKVRTNKEEQKRSAAEMVATICTFSAINNVPPIINFCWPTCPWPPENGSVSFTRGLKYFNWIHVFYDFPAWTTEPEWNGQKTDSTVCGLWRTAV